MERGREGRRGERRKVEERELEGRGEEGREGKGSGVESRERQLKAKVKRVCVQHPGTAQPSTLSGCSHIFSRCWRWNEIDAISPDLTSASP